MTPAEIITLRAPEIAEANASRIPGLIELASPTVGGFFGVRRNEAIALKVLCMISGDSASTGATTRAGATKLKEGDVEVGYAAPGSSGGNASGATWCQEYRDLGRACGAGLPRNRMVC